MASVLLTSTSWWGSPSYLAIAIARAGCQVHAIYPAQGHPLAKTKAVTRHFTYSSLRPVRSLLEAILTSRPQVVIPCDDRAVNYLHELYEAADVMGDAGLFIRALIERSLGPADSFPIVSSRYALWETARAENILTPTMKVIHSAQDLADWCGEWASPWILKADGSWGGHGVAIANTRQQAAAAYNFMRRPPNAMAVLKRALVNRDAFWVNAWWNGSKPIINVQEVVAGRPANCVAFCVNGRVVDLIAVEVVAAQSVTGPATVVRVIENLQMSDAAKKLAARLGLCGFFGFDFMIADRDGQAFLVEMNPRAALPCHLRLGKGMDLIGALVSYAGVTEPGPATVLEYSRAFAYFPQAWHMKVPNEIMKRAHHDIPEAELELVKELLRTPWPDRSLLARLSDRLRDNTFEDRWKNSCTFEKAAANLQPESECGIATERRQRH